MAAFKWHDSGRTNSCANHCIFGRFADILAQWFTWGVIGNSEGWLGRYMVRRRLVPTNEEVDMGNLHKITAV